ncbi:hypothetical protein [Pseudomonas sp. efr-133-TYG-5]|jgi:hypothetical protein|uniref:hypothetical protein n=1 Tax=Pseudomonas sp. efr-133-TYG-5 TaxID=3040310 RepID=UPI0025565AB4|nr:hypothetical protein [Pseudomonas sp. efr-133-TYG-5]
MAIVHPAFCGISADPVEPIPKRMIALCRIPPADTKHCKNRVYSGESADVFSAQTFAANAPVAAPDCPTIKITGLHAKVEREPP